MRKGWDSLSPSYRGRLERSGITQFGYESGQSIKKARGHSATPERPSQAVKKPGEFTAYTSRRQKLIDSIVKAKEQAWGNRPKWNAASARKNAETVIVAGTPGKRRPRTIAELVAADRYARGIAAQALGKVFSADEIDEGIDVISAFYYH
jgi:hypothetical protein